jgi:hypothetical protein
MTDVCNRGLRLVIILYRSKLSPFCFLEYMRKIVTKCKNERVMCLI